MITPPIVFIDTETTGLHAGARPWEIAMIRREPPVPGLSVMPWLDAECWLMIGDVDVSGADVRALKIGGFHDRHPSYGWDGALPQGLQLPSEYAAARLVEHMTRDAILVGSNPAFDARVLEDMLRRHGLCPAWHYRVIDVPTMAAARLRAPLPWRSEQLSEQCGVVIPQGPERHSALGDARWIQRWWDQLTATYDLPTSAIPDTPQEAS